MFKPNIALKPCYYYQLSTIRSYILQCYLLLTVNIAEIIYSGQ